jgi:hypothetical protein
MSNNTESPVSNNTEAPVSNGSEFNELQNGLIYGGVGISVVPILYFFVIMSIYANHSRLSKIVPAIDVTNTKTHKNMVIIEEKNFKYGMGGAMLFFLCLAIGMIIGGVLSFQDQVNLENNGIATGPQNAMGLNYGTASKGNTCFDSSGTRISCSIGSVESFSQESGPIIEYKNIGTGPAINVSAMNKWKTPQEASWKDGNGESIVLKDRNLRTQQGFMPPSFAYFPKGQLVPDNPTKDQYYSIDNYQEGRDECMRACTVTNCLAVQTEIPQNCFHEIIQIAEPTNTAEVDTMSGKEIQAIPTNADPNNPEFTNTCGNNATQSCSLFYKNLEEADDAYYQLSLGTETNNLGSKYYEYSEDPDTTPSSGYPSYATVGWCPQNITEPDIGSVKYASLSGLNDCGCVGEDVCSDENCCKMRNLLTTEFVRNKWPFYNLPMKIEEKPTSQTAVCKAVNVKYDGTTECCGMCNVDGKVKPVSCFSDKCIDSNKINCWKVDTSICNGTPFGESSVSTEAMETFLKQCSDKSDTDCANDSKCSLSNGKCVMKEPYNFGPLLNSCYFRSSSCIPIQTQVNVDKADNINFCDQSKVERGCFGSPNIITVDYAGTEIGACSNESVIPTSMRCAEREIQCKPTAEDPDACVCNDFPYGCGSQFGSNRLWIRK